LGSEDAPSGIAGLDSLIGGGFPKGSLVLVAGNPGTGKTVFSAQFLYHGAAECGENGVYVSFAEGREAFVENMRGFGLNFERLEKDGKFKFLDMATLKGDDVVSTLNLVIEQVRELGAKRLVIDSFTVLAQAFEKSIDARIILHTILSKMGRRAGCTTLLVNEVPIGSEQLGVGVEEFVADGVILLRNVECGEGRFAREIEIKKLRGKRLRLPLYLFTLEGGFRVFQPFELQTFERKERFQPIKDPEGFFSTGSESLDRMLGGGYPQGGVILFEIGENISAFNWQLVLFPTLANFIAQGRAGMMTSLCQMNADIVVAKMKEMFGFEDAELAKFVRSFEAPPFEEKTTRECTITVQGKDIMEDYAVWMQNENKLKDAYGSPLVEYISLNRLETTFGIEKLKKILYSHVVRVRNGRNLLIMTICPGLEHMISSASCLSDVHLKLAREHGTLLLYGKKPRTSLYGVDMDTCKGYPLSKLTPMI